MADVIVEPAPGEHPEGGRDHREEAPRAVDLPPVLPGHQVGGQGGGGPVYQHLEEPHHGHGHDEPVKVPPDKKGDRHAPYDEGRHYGLLLPDLVDELPGRQSQDDHGDEEGRHYVQRESHVVDAEVVEDVEREHGLEQPGREVDGDEDQEKDEGPSWHDLPNVDALLEGARVGAEHLRQVDLRRVLNRLLEPRAEGRGGQETDHDDDIGEPNAGHEAHFGVEVSRDEGGGRGRGARDELDYAEAHAPLLLGD